MSIQLYSQSLNNATVFVDGAARLTFAPAAITIPNVILTGSTIISAVTSGILKTTSGLVSAATPGIDYLIPGAQTFTATTDTVYTITDGAGFSIDPTHGNVQLITLGASRTPTISNFSSGQSLLLGIDDGAAYSITWTIVAPVWVRPGGSGVAPALAVTGYTWILLWKVGAIIYASEVGKQ